MACTPLIKGMRVDLHSCLHGITGKRTTRLRRSAGHGGGSLDGRDASLTRGTGTCSDLAARARAGHSQVPAGTGTYHHSCPAPRPAPSQLPTPSCSHRSDLQLGRSSRGPRPPCRTRVSSAPEEASSIPAVCWSRLQFLSSAIVVQSVLYVTGPT